MEEVHTERKRWDTKGGKWLVGEYDGGGEGQKGEGGGGRRDHAALSSINLSAAVV